MDILLFVITIPCIILAPATHIGYIITLLLAAWLGSRTSRRRIGYVAGIVTALYFQFGVAWFLLISGLQLEKSPFLLCFAVILALVGGWVGGLVVTRPRPVTHKLPQA